MKVKELASAALIASLVLGSVPVRAQDAATVVDRSAIGQALAARAQEDETARASIRNLLRRDEVRAMAGEMRVDLRAAEDGVASHQGAELQQAALQATAAGDLLVGGSNGTIQLSLVSLLLIIIIVILLAR